MTSFDFDERINRRSVPALKHHSIVLGTDGMDLFPAGVADMDFRVAPCIIDAMQQRAAHGVFGYETVPSDLMPSLTNWLASRHDWHVDPTTILRAPNVLNALAMALNCFTNKGDGVIIQPPVFFDFTDIIKENHRTLIENPLILKNGQYDMDLDGLERLAANPRNRMLFLCNPHNPVGRVWSKSDLSRLAEICRAHDVLVVSDEIHGDLTFQGHRYTPFASLSKQDAANSITCISPAKSFNIAACSSAFTIVPDETLRTRLHVENSRLTVNKNNAFASVAMHAAYTGGHDWLDAVLAYIQDNLSLVRARLNDMNGVTLIEPQGTFLLWLDFRDLALSPNELTTVLREKAGWALTRGISFGPQGAGFGRLNIACPRARLSRALDTLAQALSSP